jgi:hypothetical protein
MVSICPTSLNLLDSKLHGTGVAAASKFATEFEYVPSNCGSNRLLREYAVVVLALVQLMLRELARGRSGLARLLPLKLQDLSNDVDLSCSDWSPV